jgi:hypothetical protein
MKTTVQRDYTKYLFMGEQYGKGPLVHAVIKEYVEKHPKTTVEELQEVFSKKATHSVFECVEPVRKAAKGRFFLNKEDIIKAADARIAVTSQWTKTNIGVFIRFARKTLNVRIQHKLAS